jgi:hypothetical protein
VHATRPSGSLCNPVVAASESRCNSCLRPGAGDRCVVHAGDRRVGEVNGAGADLWAGVIGREGLYERRVARQS